MENTINPQFNNENNTIQKPQFLKVLCILTWLCCTFVFISTIWGAVFKPSVEEKLAQIEKIREMSPVAADKMEAALENQNGTNQIISTSITLVAVLLSFFGSVLMWQLKKLGFYFYIFGEILPYLGFAFGAADAIVAAGAMGGAMGNAIVTVVIALMIIFDIVFIVMYGVNLKYMNGNSEKY